MRQLFAIFLLFISHLTTGQNSLSEGERTRINLIDAYVKYFDEHKSSMHPGIAEGEIYNNKGEIVGGHETYIFTDEKTEKIICIEHNESKETYRTEHYYFLNDTLVYALVTNPIDYLLVKDSGKYYFINKKCYFFISKGNYKIIDKENLQKEADNYLKSFTENK